MKAIIMEKFGGPEVLRLTDFKKPTPGSDDILINVKAAGVNPVDWKIREGQLKMLFRHRLPMIPGWDAAGTVCELGANVTHFKVGDPVYAYCRKPGVKWGAYAEYVAVRAEYASPMPSNCSFAEAAAVPLAGLTAWQSLFDKGKLKAKERILIHAGAGGVGSYAIQFAKHKGATVLTTASSKNYDYVKYLGADIVIDYQKEDFVNVVKQHVGTVDFVFDLMGGNIQVQSYRVLTRGGRLVSIVWPPNPIRALFYGVKASFVFVKPSAIQLAQITELIERGEVKIATIHEMPLEEAKGAHELSQAHHVQGKIVLKVSE